MGLKPRGPDAKPRFRPPGAQKRRGPRSMQEATARHVQHRVETAKLAGNPHKFAMTDRSPEGTKTGVVFGRHVGGRISGDPALDFQREVGRRINAALKGFKPADCLVLDAEGRPIARITVDPVTRKRIRVPLDEPL